MTAPTAAGAVYDRGYRPYEGSRGGRWTSRYALWRVSVRRALGLRRSWRQKVFPWSLLAIATVPAIVNVGIGYLTRDSPLEGFEFLTYRDYVGVSTSLLLFVALTAPDVMCPDRRNRVLPLIFARPLDGRDYVLVKLAAIGTIVFGFSFLPHVVLFVGQMLVSDGALDYFTDNAEVLWQVPLSVLVLSVHFAAIGVALASTTSRRVVGGVSILAVVFVTLVVAGVAIGAAADERSLWAVVSVIDMPLYIRDLIFLGEAHPEESPLSGIDNSGLVAIGVELVVVATCVLFLFRRYRQVQL